MPSALPTAQQATTQALETMRDAGRAHQWPKTGDPTALNRIYSYDIGCKKLSSG